jgi:3',5'-cyclic AMP phosphodiesterase CpdA
MTAIAKKRHRVRNAALIVLVFIILAGVLYKVISGYTATLPKYQYNFGSPTSQSMVTYPDTSFAVISDTHYYDPSLGTTGTAFETCLNSDRKLLKDSGDLLSLAVNNILNSGVKFVMVTGDLTKDGELIDHQHVAAELQRLVEKGIKVYVVPGNHDVLNPGAVKYDGAKSVSVPNITAKDFSQIYQNCGYGSAIMRDTTSLSYVAEPQNGLWIVALDSCRYQDNKPGGEETVGGRLTQTEINWVENVLKEAKQQHKAVIVMEHHGINEHWVGQSKLHPDYLLSDYKYVSKLLSSYDVKLAFTGHYHAQDITLADNGKYGSLYDIETGSLITAPCALRTCTISGNKLAVTTDDLVGKLHPGTDFEKNANAFVEKTVYNEAYKTLKKYFVSDKDDKYISTAVSKAFIAHYSGDENPSDRSAFDENKLSLWSRIIYSQEKYVVAGLWKDLPPADNNVTLDLSKR